VRFVGDYVAFVVAQTLHQALDAAELVQVDYETLPATASTADASAPNAPKVWDGCADNIGFVQLFGDKAAADAAFAKADHVVKHQFVINRVTSRRHGARAARSATTIQRKTATPSTPPCSACIPTAPSCRRS